MSVEIAYQSSGSFLAKADGKEKPEVLAFKRDLTTKRPEQEIAILRDYYTDRARHAQEALNLRNTEEPQITGEYPIFSPYDALKEKPELLPPQEAAEYLLYRHLDLWLLTHPTRMNAIRQMEKTPYKPIIQKQIDKFDELIRTKHSVTFLDFGLDVQEPNEPSNIKQENTDPSAQRILAEGLFSWTTPKMVTLPYQLSSMPDLSGPHALATIALTQGFGFIPIDSLWSNVNNQLKVADRAFELLENDPVLFNHPEKDFILERARKLVGATLKTDPKDAVSRAKILWNAGIRTFRVYDPRSLGRLEETVEEVKQQLGDDAIIFAGQVLGPDQAHRLADKGANALICGIGEGGICDTPSEAAIVANNLLNGYEIIKSGLSIPLLFDGGIGRRTPLAISVGAAGVLKSQAIGTGIEKPPFMWWHKLENGKLASPYSGEAAGRTKWLGGKTDFMGRPLFVEGKDEYVILNPLSPSIATNVYFLLQGLATSLVFQRVSSLRELQELPNPDIWSQSNNAAYTSSIHHNSNR